ncbi:MAG: GIY-YIG nuclease family protein [Patescibacteria group bacterium]
MHLYLERWLSLPRRLRGEVESNNMYFVYILKSEKTARHYIGCTNNLERRLFEHNNGTGCLTTKIGRPWQLVCYRNFLEKEEAYAHEKLVKSYKGGIAFKKIIYGEVAEWSKAAHC